MALIKGTSIVLLELPLWAGSHRLNKEASSESFAPFFDAFARSERTNFIYRTLTRERDLATWCGALKHTKLGNRVLLIAGHGVDADDGSSTVNLATPVPHSPITPTEVKAALASAGRLSGVVALSCEFGKNLPASWLPSSGVGWALAFAAELDWYDATFVTIKCLGWMLDDIPGRRALSGRRARIYFQRGARTGRFRDRPVDYRPLMSQLGVQLYWRGPGRWQTCCPTDTTEPNKERRR